MAASQSKQDSKQESAQDGPGAGAGAGGPILVVDPDQVSRNQAEDLEDDLDRQVVAMDSMEFDLDSSGEVLEADVFIICWDLGIRSGADLVEAIRGDDRIADKTILIASEAPTRELVIWAMAAGADGVCLMPYEGEEIGRLIASASSARQAA